MSTDNIIDSRKGIYREKNNNIALQSQNEHMEIKMTQRANKLPILRLTEKAP